jgi:large conductance mechanosensitive channel
MQKLIKDFGAFVNKGNVITIAVGLVMALYFQKIVDAVLIGVIDPIIARTTSPRSGSTSATRGSRSAW